MASIHQEDVSTSTDLGLFLVFDDENWESSESGKLRRRPLPRRPYPLRWTVLHAEVFRLDQVLRATYAISDVALETKKQQRVSPIVLRMTYESPLTLFIKLQAIGGALVGALSLKKTIAFFYNFDAHMATDLADQLARKEQHEADRLRAIEERMDAAIRVYDRLAGRGLTISEEQFEALTGIQLYGPPYVQMDKSVHMPLTKATITDRPDEFLADLRDSLG